MPTFDDTNLNSTPPEGFSGLLRASEPGIEAQDVQATERAAGGRTADPDQLAALRAWLAAEAAKLRRNSECAGVPEVAAAVGGEAVGYERAARLIDRFLAGDGLPITGGPVVEPADELVRLRAQVAAARGFAEELRGYCSPYEVSVEYADRLDARLDAAAEAGR